MTKFVGGHIDRSQPLFYSVPQDSQSQAGSTNSTFDLLNKTSGRIENVLYFSRRYIFVLPGTKINATRLILIHSMAVGSLMNNNG